MPAAIRPFVAQPAEVPAWEPYGRAVEAFVRGRDLSPLLAHNSWSGIDELEVSMFFAEYADFPELEKHALSLCEGHTCDLGAGAGSHALAMQALGKDVTAIDVSPRAVATMLERGVESAVCADYREFDWSPFDSIICLMNGIGVVGDIEGLRAFFARVRSQVHDDFTLIFDASDMAIAAETQGPSYCDPPADYLGQVRFQLELDGLFGAPFDWLYVDFDTMADVAMKCGWCAECRLAEDATYLAVLKPT